MEENIYDSDFEQAYAQIRQEDLQELTNQAKEIVEQHTFNKTKKSESTKSKIHKKINIFFILVITIILLGKLYLIYPILLPLTEFLCCYVVLTFIVNVSIFFFKGEVPPDYSMYEEKNAEIINNFFKMTKIFSNYNFCKPGKITTSFRKYCHNSYKHSLLADGACKFFHPINGCLNDIFEFSNIDLNSTGCTQRHSWNEYCSFTEITLNTYCPHSTSIINDNSGKLQLYFYDKKGFPLFLSPELKTKLLTYYKDYTFEIIIKGNKLYILVNTKNRNPYYYSSYLLFKAVRPAQPLKEYFYEIYKQKKFMIELATDILKYINIDLPYYDWTHNKDNNIEIKYIEKSKINTSIFIILYILLAIIITFIKQIS